MWQLTKQDEFNDGLGTRPDPLLWTAEVGAWMPGGSKVYYTDRRENVFQDGEGHLVIRARRENFGDRQYTSARLHTGSKFDQQHGAFEVRCKFDFPGNGVHAAFWGTGIQGKWPGNGEWDGVELKGHKPNSLYQSLHMASRTAWKTEEAITKAKWHPDLTGWHVHRTEWDGDVFRWFVDGQHTVTISRSDIASDAIWAFTQPLKFILNQNVGHQWVGSPDSNTRFPSDFMYSPWLKPLG